MRNLLNKFRNDLHQIPELGFEEYKTKKYILEVLKGTNSIITEIGETGLVAYFDFKGHKTIGFRCDMDALAITEKSANRYPSVHKGIMHACGHDGHMAILLALALYLSEINKPAEYNVALIFQPSEEKAGGAKAIIDSKILNYYNVEKIFGLHVWPNLKKGQLYSRPGAMMANAMEIDINIQGAACHIASDKKGIDALNVAIKLVNRLSGLANKHNFILRFGQLNSGNARNIVASNASLKGTIRSFSKNSDTYVQKRIKHATRILMRKYGCKIDVVYKDGYAPVYNDKSLYKRISRKLQLAKLPKRVLQAEDFGLYCQKHQCLFLFLGIGKAFDLHSNDFDFSNDILLQGYNAFVKILQIYI